MILLNSINIIKENFEIVMKEKKTVEIQNYFIICNWNKKAERIIEQLQTADKNCKIVIISKSKIEKIVEFDNVTSVQEDPTNHKSLRKYNASKAKSIILLADEDSSAPDNRNAIIALTIKYLENDTNKDIHVIAELSNPDFEKHLKDAGADEIICNIDYSSGIIAQSAVFGNMSEIYQRLLSYSDNTNEIYFIEQDKVSRHPNSLIKKSFGEVAQILNRDRKQNPIILLGIKRGDQIFLNPKRKKIPNGIEIGDKLIVLSYSQVQ